MLKISTFKSGLLILIIGVVVVALLNSCKSSAGSPMAGPQVQSLPVVTLSQLPATVYQDYTASLEGSRDIEIRSQVDGYLDKIFVDEGAYVKKGQSLFQVNDRSYREKLNNAHANLAAAKAMSANAEINVAKLAPLVQNNVISDVQLKAAQSSLDAAKANVAQAQAMTGNADIDLGYTLIKAPADGYVGRIPLKTGSVVGTNVLTVLSEIKNIYAYFSLSERDFLQFEHKYEGATVQQKLEKMPQVELVLADNTVYPLKGKIETVSGQFGAGTGAISFRAVFDNKGGLLRSGNTGKIRIPNSITTAVVVPQEATFELQDKVFVFTVSDSNKVSSVPINVSSTSGNYYLVEHGMNAGTRIVFAGFGRLQEGMQIHPEGISMDSLLKVKPM
jgi:membrane fusion protein (multidrug efflux system)